MAPTDPRIADKVAGELNHSPDIDSAIGIIQNALYGITTPVSEKVQKALVAFIKSGSQDRVAMSNAIHVMRDTHTPCPGCEKIIQDYMY